MSAERVSYIRSALTALKGGAFEGDTGESPLLVHQHAETVL
jgi:hypothetical protein